MKASSQHVLSKPATIDSWPFLVMDLPWFKIKKYPHIGMPIKAKDYDWAIRYVQDKDKVATHSFLPLLHKTIVKRKFRVDEINPERNPSGKRKRVRGNPKVRDIYYASHLDGLVFSYYSSTLQKKYEKILENSSFNDSVVAYRKIPLKNDVKKNKCNIDFAKEAFDFIVDKKSENLSVIVADVTKFFDNLDHECLKRNWCSILGTTTLPKDHYNVFKALTRWQYVEESQLFEAYKNEIIVERLMPNNDSKKEYKKASIKKRRYLREKGAIAYCEKRDFLNNNLNLIKRANTKRGIPQGSAISATLANIYMIDFDKSVCDKISRIDGFYQRYSDDMIIICARRNQEDVLKFIRKEIENLKLQIHPSKTKIYHFENLNGVFTGFQASETPGEVNYNKTLEYLGFNFDGQKVLIKSAGFTKYYRGMKRSFKKSTSLTLNSKNPDKRIFKSRLYKRFTYRGAKRRIIYRPSKNDATQYHKSKKYDWGNYLSYLYKANYTMKSINGNDAIKRQSRKMWHKFHELMTYSQEKIDKRFKKESE